MTYRVRVAPTAQAQIDQFASYLRQYSEDFAVEQIDRLERTLRLHLAESPLMWAYFPLTGAPYRAYLFRVGRRIQYWIIYTVDETSRTVDVISFRGTGRDPGTINL
jgi:mRNA-degrading endonuclease RelE of RelBE toxin-antitoxin system